MGSIEFDNGLALRCRVWEGWLILDCEHAYGNDASAVWCDSATVNADTGYGNKCGRVSYAARHTIHYIANVLDDSFIEINVDGVQ